MVGLSICFPRPAMHDWLLARYRAFQQSFDPDEDVTGSHPAIAGIAALVLTVTVLIIAYHPALAPAARLRRPWVAIGLALLAAGSTSIAYKHHCRGRIGTIATLVDNMWWYFAFVYLAVNTAGGYAIGFSLAYALAVLTVTARVYGLTLLFAVVLLAPVAVLVPWFEPPAVVTLVLVVTAVLSLGVSYTTGRRLERRRGQSSRPPTLFQFADSADETLRSVLVTNPPRIIAGKYRIERVVGAGAVGLVVAARHLSLEQTVALKFLRPAAACDAHDLLRFKREAQAAVRLKSEHVCRVFDVGETEEGLPFIVLEYLEGQDLAQVLRSAGPLGIGAAVEYVLQVCSAVIEAHALGMVHRDLKPANFFLTRRHDGKPWIKVLDFGIARYRTELGSSDVSLTQTRTLLGSPVYMSPEQTRNARTVDPRSDIWSLGICLYELLTDRPPFAGDTIPGVAAAVSSDPIPPIQTFRPEVPDGLVRIIERCLYKCPDDRFQTTLELAGALEPFRAEIPVDASSALGGRTAVRARTAGEGASRERTIDSDSALNAPPARAGNSK